MKDGKEPATAQQAELEPEAQQRILAYLDEVRKCLSTVAFEERSVIIEEIRSALEEKIGILSAESGGGRTNSAMVEKAIADFGNPREVAEEYSKVTAAAPGWGIGVFFAFLACGAIILGIIGIVIIEDFYTSYVGGWKPWISMLLTGLFWLAVSSTILVLLFILSRRQALIPALGPFTALTFLVTAAWGASSLAWNDDISWLLPMVPQELKAPAIAGIGLAIFVPSLSGLWILWRFTRRDWSRKELAGTVRTPAPAWPARSYIIAATAVISAMFILANGSWAYFELTAPAGPAEGTQRYIASEFVGGPYNASIEHWVSFNDGNWWDYYKIVYTLSGTRLDGSIQLEIRPALDWIKNNTLPGDTIVSWWDYGHSIRGYTGRDSVIYMASANLINTVADRNKEGKPWEPKEKVKAVSEILLASNGTALRQGMEAFGARYILTAQQDSSGIAYAILQGAGLDPDDYIRWVEGVAIPKDIAAGMILFKVWAGGEFNGTKVVYRDIKTVVLEVL
jgi:hypothetical protein